MRLGCVFVKAQLALYNVIDTSVQLWLHPLSLARAWQEQTMCVDLRSDHGSTTSSDPGFAVLQPSLRLGKQEKRQVFHTSRGIVHPNGTG